MGGGSFETDIFVMNADGSDVTRLTTAPGIDANPDWSPDGTKIAFNSDRSGERHIHVMNADGSGATQPTFGDLIQYRPRVVTGGQQDCVLFVARRHCEAVHDESRWDRAGSTDTEFVSRREAPHGGRRLSTLPQEPLCGT